MQGHARALKKLLVDAHALNVLLHQRDMSHRLVYHEIPDAANLVHDDMKQFDDRIKKPDTHHLCAHIVTALSGWTPSTMTTEHQQRYVQKNVVKGCANLYGSSARFQEAVSRRHRS